MSNTDPPWREALSRVHYLDGDLLSRYFGTDLSAVASHPDVVLYRGAAWDAATFRRSGRLRHRRLVAEIYCRLLPLALEWEGSTIGPAPVADALLWPRPRDSVGEGWPIYVEADTGRESGRQWREKLIAYRGVESGRLWVIAQGGPGRLAHLAGWIRAAELRIGWAVSDVSAVGSALPRFEDVPTRPPLPDICSKDPSPPLFLEYRTASGAILESDRALQLLSEGRAVIRGRVRIHGGLVLILRPARGFRRRASWRKLQEFDRTPTK